APRGKYPDSGGELRDGKKLDLEEGTRAEINHEDNKVIGKDWYDGSPCVRYIYCVMPEGKRQVLTSEEYDQNHVGGCIQECSRDSG
ncbi:rhodanese-related sulfurtransferase, partial [Enterococcus faecalis]